MVANGMEYENVAEQELTSKFVTRLREIKYDTLPPYAVSLAKQCLLDWVGLVIASSEEPSVRLVEQEGEEESASGRCTALGFKHKFGPLWAALINGTAGHALDFDDVLDAMNGHPTAPVMPALVAVAEAEHLSGADLIKSFVVGIEAEAMLGDLLGVAHYARGFHATGTVGTLGASSGVASLLNLDSRQWAVALALAATQAAGLKSMFGTMGKPFHAGKAAFGGLLAAHLARRGYSAPLNVLSDPQGFLAPHSSTAKLAASALPNSSDLAIRNILFKYSASCYLTHSTIEAASTLGDKFAHDTTRIKSVVLTVPRGHLSVCNIQSPHTGLEGKFSLRYTAALALAGIETNAGSFTDQMTTQSELVRLEDKITVQPADHFANPFQSDCNITFLDGTQLSTSTDVSIPASISSLPAQWERLLAKFMYLVAPILGEHKAGRLAEAIANTETLTDISSIIHLTSKEI